MRVAPRLRTLRDRHAALDAQLAEHALRPRPDEAEVTRLKLEKLRLKDAIERLSGPTAH